MKYLITTLKIEQNYFNYISSKTWEESEPKTNNQGWLIILILIIIYINQIVNINTFWFFIKYINLYYAILINITSTK